MSTVEHLAHGTAEFLAIYAAGLHAKSKRELGIGVDDE